MIIKKVISNAVKVTFSPVELQKVRSMSAVANQTDFMGIEDYIRVMLRHAQETLDAFPDRIFDGDSPA